MTEAADYLSPSEHETMARAICDALGDSWDLAFDTRLQAKLCMAPDGSFRDINMPSKDDYLDAARACHAARPATARKCDEEAITWARGGTPDAPALLERAIDRATHLLTGEARA